MITLSKSRLTAISCVNIVELLRNFGEVGMFRVVGSLCRRPLAPMQVQLDS